MMRDTVNSHCVVFTASIHLKQFKMRKFTFIYALLVVVSLAGLISCEDEPQPQSGFLPENFSVDIPSSISSETSAGRVKGDSLNGNLVYLNLATFIAVGSGSAKLVEDFIGGIRR